MPESTSIPLGYCQCGCGGKTRLARQSSSKYGWVRGQPLRFINGHNKRIHATPADHLWSMVDKSGDCWEWQGYRDKDGYGRVTIPAIRETPIGAHQAAWIITNGPIPAGMKVCHACDNPPCCRPDHLFLGSTQVNVTDKMGKGRHGFGVTAKITPEQVREIRALAAADVPQKELARRFNITPSNVSMIVGKRRWRDA